MFGLRFLVHGQGAWQPLAGFSFSQVKNDDHKFSGTYLNDHIKGDTHIAVEIGAGVRYYQPVQEGWSPRMQLMAWYDVQNDGIDTHYSVGNGPVITITGEKPERFSVTGNLGADYIAGSATYSCAVDGSYRSDFYAVGLSCQVRYEF